VKPAGCLLLFAGVIGCQNTDAPAPKKEDRSEAELAAEAQMQGTWVLVDKEKPRTKKIDDDREDGYFIVIIQGGEMTISEGEKERHRRSTTIYSFRLDPAKTPAAMDLVKEEYNSYEDERKPGETHTRPRTRYHGIYELQPQTKILRLCWNRLKRPKEFTDRNKELALKEKIKHPDEYIGDRNTYLVLKRKPGGDQNNRKKD